MVYRKTRKANLAIALLLLVLATNFLLYQSSVQEFLSLQVTVGAAVGSIIDLVIVAPLLVFASFKISFKKMLV